MQRAARAPGGRSEEGDDAFARLLEEHQRTVYALALRLTGDGAAADDITQETFISAWRHMEGFRGGSSLKTWLLRIAVNKVRSYWRWKKLRSWVGLDDRGEDGDNIPLAERLPDRPGDRPEQAALSAELERRVNLAIAELPPRQREVAVLRSQGVALEEIGEALGMAEGTVKAHWHAARLKLERSLGEYL